MSLLIQKKTLVALVFGTSLIAGPALADCAAEIDNVTNAMATAQLSEEDKAKAETATMAAKEKAAASDEDACMTEIQVAKALLNLE